MPKFKCRITCVKIWMCLAVCGCLITLILAAVVLSSYNFESVIGPLSCKLKRIETRNCCYDEDCIYGKRYEYYFSSNSTHCMEKFDIYNHPTNTSVRFRHETSCYPSIQSLDISSPNWYINDSIIFYVNKECTEWIHSSVHIDNVNKNLMWITIILSFVGCSCISMICGFLTMYHIEILTCFVDYCCSCSNLCGFDEEDDDEEDEQTNLKHLHNGHSEDEEEHEEEDDEEDDEEHDDAHHHGSSTSSEDGHHKYKPIGHGTASSRPSTINGNMHSHLSVQYAIERQQPHQPHTTNTRNDVSPHSPHSPQNRHRQKEEMERTKMKEQLHVNTNSPKKGRGARGRGQSNASAISRLSPLSSNTGNTGNTDNNDQNGWNQYQGIRQFVVDDGDEKYRAQQHQQQEQPLQQQQQIRVTHPQQHHVVHNDNNKTHHKHNKERMTKQLKHRVYKHLIQNMNDGDHSNENGYDFDRRKFSKSPREPSHDETTVMSEDIDAVTSAGLSDSVYFENEWYDENATLTNLTSPKRSNAGTSRQSSIGGNAMMDHLKDRRFRHTNGNRKQTETESVDDEDDADGDDEEEEDDGYYE